MSKFRDIFRNHKSGSLFAALAFTCLIMLGVNSGRYNSYPERIGITFFSVFQTAVSNTTGFFKETVNSISELRELKTDYDQLLDKMQTFENLERDRVELREENALLRSQLNYRTSSGYTLEFAEIIAQDPGNLFTSLTVNKGSLDGIRMDMPVIAYQNGFQALVGKVVETGLKSSRIRPLFDTASFVAARLQSTRYEGLVNGTGSKYGNLQMNYVNKSAIKMVQEGDLVITSGMRSIYPKGIYIGRVREFTAPEWQTSLDIQVEPVVDFSRLEYIFILKEADE